MKSNFIKILILTISTLFFSCAIEPYEGTIPNPTLPQAPNTTPQYAMTAKINGEQFNANNPYGNNLFSTTNIWDYFPIADYVMLQGRKGGLLGNPEINIWLKRSQIAVGTYSIGRETFTTPPSHFIDIVDNSNSLSDYTLEGTIIITEVNPTTKNVKGTFQFKSTDEINIPTPTVNHTVTNGTFNYKYMN
jgi:hypothetical protein